MKGRALVPLDDESEVVDDMTTTLVKPQDYLS
jgi:hypothetical protein